MPDLSRDLSELPVHMQTLPVIDGRPVPMFVQWIDGAPDFRVMDSQFMIQAIRMRLCWVCGRPLGRNAAFVIGPMCSINRVSAEPPSHLDCGTWSAKHCPFLSTPARKRREKDMPAHAPMAGTGIMRNPGVGLVWVTKTWKVFADPNGTKGVLFHFGPPVSVHWYAEGRTATRDEALRSLISGYPLLLEAAKKQGSVAIDKLELMREEAFTLIPDEIVEVANG